MRRNVAVGWHAAFSFLAALLYFFFVIPRWFELTGATPHALGTALRTVAGLLIGLAALPVAFTLMRTRKPEYGTPQVALRLLIWSIMAQVTAGVLIVGTAISEIWLSLDQAGLWLFGSYGAAAAAALLGIGMFYLSFVAEMPPPAPKPITPKKPKKVRQRRLRAKGTRSAETSEAGAGAETADEEDDKAVAGEEVESAGEGSDAESDVQAGKPASTATEAVSTETATGTSDETEELVSTGGRHEMPPSAKPASGGRHKMPSGKRRSRRDK